MKTRKFTDEERELILRPANADQLKVLSKKELIDLLLCEQNMRRQSEDKNLRLEQASLSLKKKCLEKAQNNPNIF